MTRARRVHQGERTHSGRVLDDAIDDGLLGPGPIRSVPGTGVPMEGLEVPEGRVATLTVHDDGTSEAHLEPKGTELSSQPRNLEVRVARKRWCKSCRTNPDQHVGNTIVAPTGTGHLTKDGHVTLCGRDITDDWAT